MQDIISFLKEKKLFLVVMIIVVIAIVLASFFIRKNLNEKKEITNLPQNENKIEEEKKLVPSLTNGVLVEKGKEDKFPVAIIFDNFDLARPQAGLAEADIVYEAEAEGGVTRYLGIFSHYDNLKKIGPVRSARPYFVDWAEEYNSLFVHCGGSPEALVKITDESIFDLNEFYNGSYFWRASSNAPHNIFTSGELLRKYLEKENKKEGNFSAWKFKDEAKEEERPVENKIEVEFNSTYKVS